MSHHELGNVVDRIATLLEEAAAQLRDARRMLDGDLCPHCGGPGPGCPCENDE